MERRAEAPPPQGLDFTVENVEKVSESRRPGRGRGGAGGTQRRDAEGAAVLRGMRVGERGGTCSAVPGTARAAGGVPCACPPCRCWQSGTWGWRGSRRGSPGRENDVA